MIGIEFNTFSIVGRCAGTGRLGVAITTSDVAVGSRCPYVLSNVGAVSTQASTDPRLGPAALRLIEAGESPETALQELASKDRHIERRQLGLVDSQGRSAARTGAENAEWAGHVADENFVAMGNGLVGERVVQAMAKAFRGGETLDLEERLLLSLEAGQKAGGEARDSTPYHSATLLVYGSESYSRADLRVDEHPTPISELRRVFEVYRPKIEFYALRATDPE